MTQCSLQLCLCRFICQSGEALYGECSYIEEKAVYINIIHGKTVQWKTRKESCSILKIKRIYLRHITNLVFNVIWQTRISLYYTSLTYPELRHANNPWNACLAELWLALKNWRDSNKLTLVVILIIIIFMKLVPEPSLSLLNNMSWISFIQFYINRHPI